MSATISANLLSCLKACLETMQENQHCAAECMREGQQALICLDCADICEATAKVLSRESEHHAYFCALCAQICTECAARCDKMNAEHCKRCAEACRKCAQECQAHAKSR